MAKYYNNKIKTGRVAGSVFAVRNGEVIERAYNPIVLNPKSEAQVEARAKLKLLSQLGAVLGGDLAIAKQGNVSARNIFTRVNYPSVVFENGVADIPMTSIQLTASAIGLPALNVSRGAQTATTLNASLVVPTNAVDHMVYVVLGRDADGALTIYRSVYKADPGVDNNFYTAIENVPSAALVVLGYGISVRSERAKAVFGNITADMVNHIVSLITSRTLTDGDVVMTKTNGSQVAAV